LRAIERIKQRKLSIGQIERTQRVIEAPGNHAGGALQVQAQTVIANMLRRCKRNIGGL
jgi:hypothetical protein